MQLQPCRLEALSGSAGYSYLRATIVSSGLVVLLLHSAGVFAQARCPQPAARAASVEGRVEARADPQSAWQRVRPDDALCAGDSVRVLELSRAGLLLANDVLLRLDQNSVLTLGEAEPEKPSVMELLRGWLHVITRHRKQFRVTTPVVNAVVEGTEFTVSTGPGESSVAVNEGRVQMQSQGGALALESGQAAVVRGTGAPQPFPRVRPLDAVQWALYFPPVLRHRPSLKDPALSKLEQEAAKLALESDATGALERVGQIPSGARSEPLRAFEASLLLSVGRVDEAAAILKAQAASAGPDALALDAIMQLISGDRGQAAARAEAAVRAGRTAAALLAQSFVRQSEFKLEEALQSARSATEVEPENAIAWARLSELELSTGEVGRAREAAERALKLSPGFGRGHTILGFVLLVQGEIEQAQQSFAKAASYSQGDPLVRLGNGLALIRTGKLAEGRRELELAVLLDPGNSLLRSYLGKAYSDELRDELADAQLGIAKDLDPRDPTPWFYNAIRLQALNRPGEALQELQESIARNDNRAVYRSRLLLDQDQAARSASQARIYSDLGFDQLAVTEAMSALDSDPHSFSAHRFLADAYASLPRFESARVSELLQSQLLQPASAAVLAPRLGEAKIPILEGAGPITPSFHEFNPLLVRDGHLFSLGAVVGGQGTVGDEALYASRSESSTVQVGQFYYETNGFRPNADLRQRIYSFFYQEDLSFQTSWQAEARTSRLENGDVRLQFDPEAFSLNERQRTEADSLRVGFRHSLSPHSTWLASFVALERSGRLRAKLLFPGLSVDVADDVQVRSQIGEIQYLGGGRGLDVVAGGGLVRHRDQTSLSTIFTFEPFPPDPPDEESIGSLSRHGNAYVYGLWRVLTRATITTGLAFDDFSDKVRYSQRRFSPKFGLVVPIGTGTTLRAAAFRSVKRLNVANQTLEPTQVAGFNQLFDDIDQVHSQRIGVGIDQRFSRTFFGGVELSRRDLETPILGAGDKLARYENWDEQLHRTYVNWLAGPNLTGGVDYFYERRDREPALGGQIPVQVVTHYAPMSFTYHHASGFFATLRTSYVSQKLRFAGTGGAESRGETDFWLADVSTGVRFPRRTGSVTLDVFNLFDRRFQYQDTDFVGTPRVPLFQPVRLVLVRARFGF